MKISLKFKFTGLPCYKKKKSLFYLFFKADEKKNIEKKRWKNEEDEYMVRERKEKYDKM